MSWALMRDCNRLGLGFRYQKPEPGLWYMSSFVGTIRKYCSILIYLATPCDHDMFDTFGTSAAASQHHDTNFFNKSSLCSWGFCIIVLLFQAAEGYKSSKRQIFSCWRLKHTLFLTKNQPNQVTVIVCQFSKGPCDTWHLLDFVFGSHACEAWLPNRSEWSPFHI